MNKLRCIIVFILLVFSFQSRSQDAPISQWYSNQVMSNPAMAGSTGDTRLNLFYRNQWPGNDARFQFYGVAFDQAISKYSLGWGVIATNEKTAFFNKPSIHILYSYKIKTNKGSTINFGFKTGIYQEFLSAGELQFEDEETISSSSSGIKFDFGAGVSIIGKNTFGGITVDHLNRSYQGISGNTGRRTNVKYSANLAYLFYLPNRLIKQQYIIMPNLTIQMQGQQQNVQFGVLSQINYLISGIWIRQNIHFDAPAIIFLAGIKTLDTRIAYSFDIYSSKKKFYGSGTHEISITKIIKVKEKIKREKLSCPTFLQ
jgi:type IX secretion system PorP/SprF family membrane protein